MVTELIKEVRLNYTAGDRGMDQKGHFTEPFKIKEKKCFTTNKGK